MSFIDGLRHRAHVLLRRGDYMRNAERELRFHAELETASRAGQVGAELSVRRIVGNVTYYREETRRMTTLRWLDWLVQDATYAARSLRRTPGFTMIVVLTLALGFGVNAAMYTMLDQVFRREPAGVARPREVRRLYQNLAGYDNPKNRFASSNFSYRRYRALAAAAPLNVAAFTVPDSVSVVEGQTSIPARSSTVTASYFSILGIRPALGRFFVGDEARIETQTPVAVVSDAFWRHQLGGDSAVLGRTVSIHQRRIVIIGVAPRGFTGVDLDAVDLWLPANMYPGNNSIGPWYENDGGMFQVLTRLDAPSDEVRLLAVAPSALQNVLSAGERADPGETLLTGSIVSADGPAKPAQEVLVAKKISWIGLLVLLIAGANVANLLLLRAASRRREIAVRRALGVSHARLCGQLVTESLLLSLIGGVTAVVVALWTGTALRRLMLPKVHWASGPVDAQTLWFILGITVLIGLTTGLVPTLQALRPNLIDSLKAGMRSGAYQTSSLRSALVVAQTAFCVILVVGAGLFVRSLRNVQSIDLGYGVDDVTIFVPTFAPGQPDLSSNTALPEAADRLSRVDGVVAAAYAISGSMLGSAFGPLALPDRDSLPRVPGDIGPSYNVVSPDYFRATGLAIRSGRAFNRQDDATHSRSVIVSELMARTYWPGSTPIGKCLIVGKRTSPCSIVVGVAADAHRRTILESPILQYYLPMGQRAGVAFATPRLLVVRSLPGRELMVAREVDRILNQLIPGMDGVRIEQMSNVLEPQLRPWRLGATLFTAFGVLACTVAGIGIYSVVAYSVAQRTHEMGVRMALGARASDIFDLVLSDGLRPLAIGVVIGLIGAYALGRVVASLLFGITPNDPSVLISAVVVLSILTLLACVVPGWRAIRVSPATALRAD